MITGGDALVGVAAAPDTDLSALRVTLDGLEVTDAFRPSSSGILMGLLEDLAGAGEVRLDLPDGTPVSTLSLQNHPIAGPVFSGPHEHPFMCETEAFELLSGETLGPPLDDASSIERRVDYAYLPSGGEDRWREYSGASDSRGDARAAANPGPGAANKPEGR